ncbi:GIY-YIG nuclease family protein [Anaerotignum sp.]|uniref:GIY-YIG nuclease family protein n=1 Tax=Anaerotignum sp. TaxID=2039241 RepID=UPI0027148D80|nr:GIY-YIG nuclease family protein [Anaerotignum sp.]
MGKSSNKSLKEQYKNRALIGGVYCVKCNDTMKPWVRATTDLQRSKNRFLFSISMNSAPEPCMHDAWNEFGGSAFSFEILEEIQKKKTQTDNEFSEDVDTLLEIWTEKLNIEWKGENEFGKEN